MIDLQHYRWQALRSTICDTLSLLAETAGFTTQARTLRPVHGAVRSPLRTLSEHREAASTEAVTPATTPALPLQA